LQWNVLADGLGQDGFLSTEFSPIRESPSSNSKKYEASQFVLLVRQAKLDDAKSGAIQAMNNLKKAEKKLKKMAPNKSADQTVLQQLKTDIASMKGTIEKSKLVHLKQEFERSPELERVDTEILDWNVRYSLMKALLLRTDPDIITFQEMDHLKQFLDDATFSSIYTCMVDPNCTYQTPTYGEDKTKDDRRPENFLPHLLQSKAAFCPKSYSNAYNFRKKRSPLGADLDDDGVAIFWKKDKFQPIELGFLHLPSKPGESKTKGGCLAVTLLHKASNQSINVLTAHLPAGDDVGKEQERLATLKNPSAAFVAQRLRRQDNGAWKQVIYEANQKFDGIISFVKYYSDRTTDQTNPRTVFALDTNSRPTFPLDEGKTNVWNSIRQGCSKLECIWVQNSFLDDNGNSTKYPIVASVNKMRGPSSDQPSKIGEHQLELIDHIFTDAPSKVVQDDQASGSKYVQMAPVRYPAKEGHAEVSLIPNIAMPSDHLPVVVDIQL